MHEMSLCESLLQILQQQAQVQQYQKVKTVWLEIGVLSNIELEALRFSFDIITQGSLAAGAKLEIIPLPGQAWCLSCACNIVIQEYYAACPHCGEHQLQINNGDQMRIKELEVE